MEEVKDTVSYGAMVLCTVVVVVVVVVVVDISFCSFASFLFLYLCVCVRQCQWIILVILLGKV